METREATGAAVTHEWRDLAEIASHCKDPRTSRRTIKRRLDRLAATGAIDRTVNGNGDVLWRLKS